MPQMNCNCVAIFVYWGRVGMGGETENSNRKYTEITIGVSLATV